MSFAKKLFFISIFFSLLMDSGGTASDPWEGFAGYFHADIKSWLPQSGIILNPLEIIAIVVFLAWALRGRRDRRFRFERGLLFWPMIALLGVLAAGVLWGAIQPGDNLDTALWEIRELAYCVIIYFLVGILFTHRRDLNTLTWILLISAFLLGLECLIRYYFFIPGHVVGDLDYDHDDATVLAFAIVLSVGMLLLGSTRRQRFFALATIPFDVLALMVTQRRAGEAALAVGLVCLAIILLRVNKSLFFKIVPVTALVLSIYLAAYWNCTSGTLCQPARALTSQINPDPRDLSSDQYRYIETQDLILNIDSQPVTGLGFGQQFAFYIPLPDESFWPFWHYTPHNAILWIWVKAGVLGFFVFWWVAGSGLYRGGRLIQALSAAGDNKARALVAGGTSFIIMQITVSYVDLGLTSDRDMLLLGLMLGIIGHLPAILRRSANLDVDDRRGKGQAAPPLATETPEVQAGILAHALESSPRTTTRRQPPAQSSKRPGWGQPERAASWRRASRPSPPGQTTGPVLQGSAPRPSRWPDNTGTP